MISYIVETVNLLVLLLQKFITISAFVGQLIVICISSAVTLVVSAISYLLLFFQIVYEDNLYIFTEDLPRLATYLFDNVNYQCNYVLDAVIAVCNEINYNYHVSISAIKWFIETVLIVCGEVLLIWKKTLIFVGECMWLVLTFVPVHLPYIIKTILNNISDYIVSYIIDAYMLLLKFTNFLSDVPLESFVGILSAMLIAQICIYYRESVQFQIINIYWKIITNVLYLYYTLYYYFTDPEVRMIISLTSGQPVAIRDVNLSNAEADDAANAADNLCIICQERPKCILTLPCRHICLCSECCIRLYGYQRTCPMCRTFIQHSVTVYF